MRTRLVGLAGPSGAGKTSLARAVQARFAPGICGVLPIDAYYCDLAHLPPEARAQTNFDAPDAIDTALLFAHARRLHAGEAIALPAYDFATHTRHAKPTPFGPYAIILVEGLFALYWPVLSSLYDRTLYLDVSDIVALERRIDRDSRERGRDRQSVLDRYQSSVRPMAERYVWPTRSKASLLLDGTRSINKLSFEVFRALDE